MMSKSEQKQYLRELRESINRFHENQDRAYSNQGAYCPPYKVDRFDGFHDND